MNQNPMMMNDSDIFNDNMDGGGIEPSINETIRESIQCSFVSSECNQSRSKDPSGVMKEAQENLRDFFVMNRMNWITYLKVLFDQLESFNSNKQKHVENANFLKALQKIKNLLPLSPKNDYYKTSCDVAFSYKDVETGVIQMPKYITWDNVIDIFLAKKFTSSITNNPQEMKAFQQFQQNEQYPSPQKIEEEDIKYDIGEVEPILRKRQKETARKSSRKDEQFFVSFADSVLKMTPQQLQTLDQQQKLFQNPLLNPTSAMDQDDDDACEIQGDSEDDDESESNQNSQIQNNKAHLEDSIRSSRTATFKSIRQTNQNPIESYYALKNGLSNKQSTTFQYQQTGSAPRAKEKDNSDEDQVEVGSQNQSISSIKQNQIEVYYPNEEPHHHEKSTRISSQFSNSKVQAFQNNTILSQSSQSSTSNKSKQKQNNSKNSGINFNQNSILNSSNIVDIDLQGKGLKGFEIDFKQAYGDKRQLRAINLSHNSLVRLTPNIERSLQFMNVSFNKLKSLHGIEYCVNLKFLNVQGNQITSTSGLSLLQNLREVIFANNQISIIKELGSLRNLQLLDLSYNKVIDFDKLCPLQNLRKLSTLCLMGNIVAKSVNYEVMINKLFPSLQVLDPQSIKEHSQFLNLEHFCFSDLGEDHPIRIKIETDLKKDRSKTPTRDRSSSRLQTQQTQEKKSVKSMRGSPHNKLTQDSLDSLNKSKIKTQRNNHEKRHSKDHQTLQNFNDVQIQLSAHKDSVVNSSATKRLLAKIVEREEEKRSNSNSKSRSNVTRNRLLPSGRMTANPISQQPIKESLIKRVQVNVNPNNKTISMMPKPSVRSNVTTPREEKQNIFQSMCQSQENSELHFSPSEKDKNYYKTQQTQETSTKKNNFSIKKQLDLTINMSPQRKQNQINSVLVPHSTKNNPSFLRQKLPPYQKQDSVTKENKSNCSQSFINRPQTTRNQVKQNQSQSFVFETGRQTPSHRPNSQLQQFINASNSKKPQVTRINTYQTKINQLPPRAYQSRAEMPGEKKSKADMSSSRITQNMYASNISSKQLDSDESISSKSLSPVCEEEGNVRKYKVDLQQLMKS